MGIFRCLFHKEGPVAEQLEKSLFEKRFELLLVRQSELPVSALPSVISVLWSAGIAVVYAGGLTPQERVAIQAITEDRFFEFPAPENSAMADEVLQQALSAAETLRIGTDFPNEGVFSRT